MMAVLAITALILGMIYGASGMENVFVSMICSHTDLILSILMFSVGISIGLKRGILQNIKTYHFKILMIPAAVVNGGAG